MGARAYRDALKQFGSSWKNQRTAPNGAIRAMMLFVV
jgi:hypothetical protein